MTDIPEMIVAALSSVGVPVAFQEYRGAGSPPQYITFMETTEVAEEHAGDDVTVEGRYVQLNIWSKIPYYDLIFKVKRLMDAAGFEQTFSADAPYDAGAEYFNRVMRFSYFDELEGE